MGYSSKDMKTKEGAGTYWNNKNEVIISCFKNDQPTDVTVTLLPKGTMNL